MIIFLFFYFVSFVISASDNNNNKINVSFPMVELSNHGLFRSCVTGHNLSCVVPTDTKMSEPLREASIIDLEDDELRKKDGKNKDNKKKKKDKDSLDIKSYIIDILKQLSTVKLVLLALAAVVTVLLILIASAISITLHLIAIISIVVQASINKIHYDDLKH